MHFSQVISTVLLASSAAVASPLLSARQDANSVIGALDQTSNALVALNNSINALTPNNFENFNTALQIQTESDNLVKDLQSAISAANAINGQLDDDDTLAIATVVSNLVPYITSTLNNLVAHKPEFATAVGGSGDLSQTVEADLTKQQQTVGQLGAALQPHASADYASIVPLLTNQIEGLFDQALAAYSTCSGQICLPPFDF